MNDGPRTPQLLDCSHVAMVAGAREDVHLDSPITFVPWNASAFWPYGKIRNSQVQNNRVSANQEPAMESGRSGADIQRPLRRNSLPDCCGSEMGDERAGAGRPLLSKKQETEWA